MIVIIDYGIGNTGSLLNMLHYLSIPVCISGSADKISQATHLILPGVGSFDKGVGNLEASGILPVLNEKVLQNKTPVLGICLGAQLMLEKSEEGKLPGLGWIKGSVIRFKSDGSLKIPHMGWNSTDILSYSGLFDSFQGLKARYYFVHSYHFKLENEAEIVAVTKYGYYFTSAYSNQNIFGVQFHPEKSHSFGMQLLKNFYRIS